MEKKIKSNKLIQMWAVLILSVLLMPSTVFSYSVLWDTSHGVFISPTYGGDGYQPSGYYHELAQHLANNGFTVDTPSDGFDPTGYDVIVVCVASAWEEEYTDLEAALIVDFVAAGGGLLIMGDHPGARNANIQPVADEFDEFGITFGVSYLDPVVYTSDLADHCIFNGVSEIFMHVAGELSVSGQASAVAWQEGDGKPIAAVAEYGQGRVVALGDCSLWSWVETYEENFDKVDNPQFSVNTFTYLAIPEPATVLLLGLGSLILLRNCKSAKAKRIA